MTWRTLVTAIGTVVIAGLGAVAVYQANDGVTPATLVDAGILDDCAPKSIACPVVYCDAGHCSPPRFRAGRGAWCGVDGGVVLPDLRPGWRIFRPDLCRQVTRDAGVLAQGEEEDVEFECACRGASGVCRVRLEDGGIGDAPFGVTVGPGYGFSEFGGAGCVRKSCGVLAGPTDDSWPSGCPQ